MTDTIFALSSGAPPAAIAVLRISGPDALAAAAALAGRLPAPRNAGLRTLRDTGGTVLDRALILVFPGPTTATGEDLAELHLHGGRAIVRAVEAALAALPGLRRAEPGEFTRRALANGIIDLAQAEGLADLLHAETEVARRAALATADGAVSRAVAVWLVRLYELSARAEALIDFADEDDVPAAPDAVTTLVQDVAALAEELATAVARPSAERLHDGIRIVFAGPPNSGKSSLVNALAGREVAIATPLPGTTRDRIEVPVIHAGVAYVLTDVAGLRETTEDPIEAIGIGRARDAMAQADLVVWLGDEPPPKADMLAVHPRADLPDRAMAAGRLAVSTVTGVGIGELWQTIAARTAELLPVSDDIVFNLRQREKIAAACTELSARADGDLLVVAEILRSARRRLTEVTGAQDIEGVLDALFGRFCIGK